MTRIKEIEYNKSSKIDITSKIKKLNFNEKKKKKNEFMRQSGELTSRKQITDNTSRFHSKVFQKNKITKIM